MSHVVSLSQLCLAPNPQITVQRHLTSPVPSSSGSKSIWTFKLLGVPNLSLLCVLQESSLTLTHPLQDNHKLRAVPWGCGRDWTHKPPLPRGLQSQAEIESRLHKEGTLAVRALSGSCENHPVKSVTFYFFFEKTLYKFPEKNAWATLMVRVPTWALSSLLLFCPYLFKHL